MLSTLIRIAATCALVVAVLFAYPIQRELAGVPLDTRVGQMQAAHAAVVLTVSALTWPRRPDVWFAFAVTTVAVLAALVLVPTSPPIMFTVAWCAGIVAAGLTDR